MLGVRLASPHSLFASSPLSPPLSPPRHVLAMHLLASQALLALHDAALRPHHRSRRRVRYSLPPPRSRSHERRLRSRYAFFQPSRTSHLTLPEQAPGSRARVAGSGGARSIRPRRGRGEWGGRTRWRWRGMRWGECRGGCRDEVSCEGREGRDGADSRRAVARDSGACLSVTATS